LRANFPPTPARRTGVPRTIAGALATLFVLALAATAADAESLVCYPIKRGESATQVARRITGDSRNTYRSSFQIMNSSSRFVPKSQYDRVRAGWRACVIAPVVRASVSPSHVTAVDARDASGPSASATPLVTPAALVTPAGPVTPVAPETPETFAAVMLRPIRNLDLTIVWLSAAMVMPWFGWRILDDYLARRKTATVVIRHFADRFVSEFERPLVRYDAEERPMQSRVRYRVRPGRFDILLAPGEGRRYPNLSDHRKNVEYDVARIVDVLADASFVSGALYTQAGWVVVPFQFKSGPKHTGVTCISSF
jgi:hypothetical protein